MAQIKIRALLMIGLGMICQVAQGQPSGARLRSLAGNLHIGCATDSDFWNLPDTALYQQNVSSEYNIITVGNQLKWDTTEPQQGVFNFAPADMHLQFAQKNGMLFHGHVLVWHNQLPGWVSNTQWTSSPLIAVLQNHIANEVGHFKGKAAIWDVVNEAFNDGDGGRRSTIWQNTIGPQFIELAFQSARAADPSAELVYNDFNIETLNSKSDAVFAMAQDFKKRGIPIDGIGIQGHLTASGVDPTSFAANMQTFAALGLKIHITELDVRLALPASASDLKNQAAIYRNVLDTCLKQPACTTVQMWGVSDKYSWIPGTFPGFGAALLFDANYSPKPAYFALQSRLAANLAPDFSLSASPAALTVNQGGSGASTISITPAGGFNGAVALSISGLPSGVVASLNPPSTNGSGSTLTVSASSTAATGAATITIAGNSGALAHAISIQVIVNRPASGAVIATPVLGANSPWFTDEGISLKSTVPITALSVAIIIQNTGRGFSGMYNTVGGSIAQSHSSTASAISYQFNLSPGQTLSPGTGWLFDAQMSGSGTAHPSAGDLFLVTYTSGGQTFTIPGRF